jgi:uncharacterized membrane protein YsdA (DUF1294 family)/cold shock CspA family protein
MADTRSKGKIKSWNDEKGFGFITPLTGGKQIFVHINAFSNRKRRPAINQVVTYSLSTDKQGRTCATRATLAGDHLPNITNQKNGSWSIIIAVLFVSFVGVTIFTAKTPPLVFAVYLVASLITFLVYASDKSAARKSSWRTPESTLHLLSLAGGWPGALVAQQKLRHKSRKQPFRAVFWMTVLINCGALFWSLTPEGSAVLQSLIASLA